jgi:hypothetical protein
MRFKLRNQTRFPVSWLRTPTVRLNLDLALPHWRDASARIPATKGAACIVSYGPRDGRMRAQHQTQITVHVRKLREVNQRVESNRIESNRIESNRIVPNRDFFPVLQVYSSRCAEYAVMSAVD